MKLTTIALLALCFSAFSQDVVQVTDLAPGSSNGVTDEAIIIENIGRSVLWTNDDRGGQIYFTNGITYETVQLFESEADKRVFDYTILDDLLYFCVIDYDSRDHTMASIDEEGTLNYIAQDVETTIHLTPHEGKVYFEYEESIFSNTLSSYDVTTGEIEKLFDIENFGSKGGIVFRDEVYYLVFLSNGLNLVKLNDTPQGYEVLINLHNGSEFTQHQNMTATEDYLYFFSTDRNHNYSLYASDGTQAGTVRMSTDFEEINFLNYRDQSAFMGFNNKLYFPGKLVDEQFDSLYVADASTGVVRLIDVVPGEAPQPRNFRIYNDELYFSANEVTFFSSSIYKIDETGFNSVKVIDPGQVRMDFGAYGYHLTEHDDLLFFTAFSDNGRELWSSNGMDMSAEEIKDLRKGDTHSSPFQLESAEDNLFMFAYTDSTGRELFVYNQSFISSVEGPSTGNDIVIYPNPTDQELVIYSENNQDELNQLEIMNIHGQLMILGTHPKEGPNTYTIDVSVLKPGMYLITNRNRRFSRYFIKV